MRRTIVVVGLLASSSLWSVAAQAADKPLYAPAPAWIKPVPPIEMTKLDDTSPVVIVHDHQQRLADGTVIDYVDSATRIGSTQLQSQLGTITLSWQPDHGDLTIHGVEILRGSEKIDLVAGKQPFSVLRREQRLEQLELDGTLTATLQVEGLRIGDVLRVVHSRTVSDKALAGRMQAQAPVIAAPGRATFARMRIVWPANTPV